MLEGQEVEYVNVHNAGPGCFAVRIERGWGREGKEAVRVG
jgi:hypothetical protein